MNILSRKFYHRDTLRVARELLGRKRVCQINGVDISILMMHCCANNQPSGAFGFAEISGKH